MQDKKRLEEKAQNSLFIYFYIYEINKIKDIINRCKSKHRIFDNWKQVHMAEMVQHGTLNINIKDRARYYEPCETGIFFGSLAVHKLKYMSSSN